MYWNKVAEDLSISFPEFLHRIQYFGHRLRGVWQACSGSVAVPQTGRLHVTRTRVRLENISSIAAHLPASATKHVLIAITLGSSHAVTSTVPDTKHLLPRATEYFR